MMGDSITSNRRQILVMSRSTMTSAEQHIMDQFTLIYKVFNEIIEDLSRLNRLNSSRASLSLKKNDQEAQTAKPNEAAIKKKIDDNLMFCMVSFC